MNNVKLYWIECNKIVFRMIRKLKIIKKIYSNLIRHMINYLKI